LFHGEANAEVVGPPPDDAGPFLAFLVFRFVPALLALLILVVGEWLFLKLRASGRE